MEEKNKFGLIVTGIVLLVIGLGAGFTGAKLLNGSDKPAKNVAGTPDTATKAANLRTNLTSLAVQHVIFMNKAIDSTLDNNKDASNTKTLVANNDLAIAEAFGAIYGGSARETLEPLLKLQSDQLYIYAQAVQKNDQSASQSAVATITDQSLKPMVQYLANLNPDINAATLQASLSEHLSMTTDMIDAHVKGDYQEENHQLGHGIDHLSGVYASLAADIVKQKPDQF